MVQHQPGPVCGTFRDTPFLQNVEECARFYQKTYDLAVAPGTISNNGDIALWNASTANPIGPVRFYKRMSKAPVCTAYNPVTGAVNSMRQSGGRILRSVLSEAWAKPGLRMLRRLG